MFQTHTFILLVMTLVLAACGGAPAVQSNTNAPAAPAASGGAPTAETIPTTAAAAPTAEAAAPAMPAPTTAAAATTAPAATSAALADPTPEKPNDKTQGRLRISNCVMDGPRVDTYINGKLSVNGGRQQVNLGALDATGYLYLAPSTYSVAIVPTSQGIDKALLGPLDVQVVAGHRYLVVLRGGRDEPQRTPLVIDETAEYQKAGLLPSDSGYILINNYKGAKSLGWSANGVRTPQVPYGEYAAWRGATGNLNANQKDIEIITTGPDGKESIEKIGSAFIPQGMDWFDCFAGTYPAPYDTHTSREVSLLDPIAFMQLQTKLAPESNGNVPSFTTLLKALETTGMTEMLANGGPFLLFAPTDEAFKQLAKAQLDALLADPKALAELLRGHIVEGYFPLGTMSSGPGAQGFNRTMTNLRGEQITITGNDDDVSINGESFGSLRLHSFVANGTRFWGLNRLILPAKK